MKSVLREQILEKRKALPPSFLEEKSTIIIKHLSLLPAIEQAKTILSYISFGNEVYTHDFIRSSIKKKNIVVPFVADTTQKKLSLSYLSDWNNLLPGNYGILEPSPDHVTPAEFEDIDICVIPGVAFDTSCHRIGYGYGYFDRILKKIHTLKIGLAFEVQILNNIPITSYDVPMDCILTEKRFISYGKHGIVSKTYKSSKYKGQS
jgi:5-formyltetrahydrofolate cyclo-ligase